MMLDDLENIKHKQIQTTKDIFELSRLSKVYCYHQVPGKNIKAIMDQANWSYGELLSDLVYNTTTKNWNRQMVAGVLFIAFPFNHHPIEKHLAVRIFACEPWYELDNTVKWIKYRVTKLLEDRTDFVGFSWMVDEHNEPLIKCLSENEFHAKGLKKVPSSNNKGNKEYISKIQFIL